MYGENNKVGSYTIDDITKLNNSCGFSSRESSRITTIGGTAPSSSSNTLNNKMIVLSRAG